MVLISFSILDHINKIKTGLKSQTTRIPRKMRSNGKPAYSVGEKVQLYYKPRMKDSCDNCIVTPQPDPCNFWHAEMIDCPWHKNFFGESEIVDIIHYHSGDYQERHHEVWTGYTLAHADDEDKESWAIADGFINFDAASDYFYKSTSNPNWADQNLDVIVWSKNEIIKKQNAGEQK